MHFAAFLDVGESVREPARLLPQQRRRRARACSRRWRPSRCSTSCSRRPAPPTASRSRRRSPRRIRSSRSTATARPSWPSSARCRTSSARYGMRSVALRYFNAAGADPDGEIGEDHAPEIHLIPRAIDAATGGRGLQVFGDDYPTPDGTCLRDYIHVVRSRRRARPGARGASSQTGTSGAYNLGTGTPHSVREVIDAVERVTGAPVPWTLGAAPSRRSRGALRGAAQGAGRAALDAALRRPRHDRRAPPGTGTARIRTGIRGPAVARHADRRSRCGCFRYATAVPRPLAVGGRRRWCVYAVGIGRPGVPDQADLRRRAADAGASLAFIAWAIVGVYLLKGIGVVRLVVPDGRRRPARRDGSAQRALPPHPRPVGGVLRARARPAS